MLAKGAARGGDKEGRERDVDRKEIEISFLSLLSIKRVVQKNSFLVLFWQTNFAKIYLLAAAPKRSQIPKAPSLP